MKIEVTDITTLYITDKILELIPDYAIKEISLREEISEIIKNTINKSLSDVNNEVWLI